MPAERVMTREILNASDDLAKAVLSNDFDAVNDSLKRGADVIAPVLVRTPGQLPGWSTSLDVAVGTNANPEILDVLLSTPIPEKNNGKILRLACEVGNHETLKAVLKTHNPDTVKVAQAYMKAIRDDSRYGQGCTQKRYHRFRTYVTVESGNRDVLEEQQKAAEQQLQAEEARSKFATLAAACWSNRKHHPGDTNKLSPRSLAGLNITATPQLRAKL